MFMTTHGRLLQFADAQGLLAAVDALRARGYTRLQAFTPYELDGLAEKLGSRHRRLPLVMLVAGIVGGAATLAMQYYAAAIDYPIDVGGRPAASWPAFVPAAIEMSILAAVVTGFAVFLWRSGLPALYRPVFNIDWFELASRDGFLLLIRADDPLWEEQRVLDDSAEQHPLRHAEVPA
jgi:hypothetical protein